jgi:hypothetical protein
MDSKTPEQMRTDWRVELSKLLYAWLPESRLTHRQFADLVGVSEQKVQRWCDHRNKEVPSLSDVRLFPRDLAAKAFRSLAALIEASKTDDDAKAILAMPFYSRVIRNRPRLKAMLVGGAS